MAKLSYGEKRDLEEFLRMGGGYVLDFSNRTFREFIFDSVRLDIDDENVGGYGSKACRLRNFWSRRPDHIVGKLLKDMIEFDRRGMDSPLRPKCLGIAERLLRSAPVPDAEVIASLSEREEFEQLASGVLDAIHKNNTQGGLDRLHTFTVKFVRSLCTEHGVAVDRDKALHSIFGEYVKKLKSLGLIESRMTETILKTSISVMEAFSDVRNNKSLAHDNEILNEAESLLIFNNVTSVIRFLWALEQSIAKPPQPAAPVTLPDEDTQF